MPMKKLLLLLSAPLFVNAATLGGGGDPRALDLSQKFDFSAAPAAQVGTYVATQAEGKLKGVKRVAITNMCVQFVAAKSAMGYSAGSTIAYTRSASGGIPGGLDPARMQVVADAWLEQIEADLKAMGIELVPYDQLASNDLFKKFAAKYDTGIRVGARDLGNNKKGDAGEAAVYVSPKGRPFAPDCGQISPASTGTFVRMAYPLDAEFLTVSAVIDMGQAKSSGGLLRGASADIDYAQYLRAGDSQFQFVGKSGPGARLWLKQSIVPAINPFTLGEASTTRKTEANTSYDGTTTVERTATTSRAIGFDEDLYYRNAAQALTAMHRMFLEKFGGK
jgi:hypothetical protein